MMPIEKKRGSTVLGVKIGLQAWCQYPIQIISRNHMHLLTAMPSTAAAEMPYLFDYAIISRRPSRDDMSHGWPFLVLGCLMV